MKRMHVGDLLSIKPCVDHHGHPEVEIIYQKGFLFKSVVKKRLTFVYSYYDLLVEKGNVLYKITGISDEWNELIESKANLRDFMFRRHMKKVRKYRNKRNK